MDRLRDCSDFSRLVAVSLREFQGPNGPRNKNGQIVVEYVLLLGVVVSLAFFATKQLVSRSADEPGMITQKWCKILEGIGQDQPEEKNNPGAGAAGSICP